MLDLGRSPVLAALAPSDRARLVDHAVPVRLVKGERLYLAGDRARRAHVILSGALKLVARGGGGREAIVYLAVPGEIIGEVAALDGAAQPLDAIAAVKTELVGFDGELLIEILGHSPGAAMQLARAMAARMRWMSDSAGERSAGEVPARLAGRLLHLAALIGHEESGTVELNLPLAQGDLGRLAGMCRESACKTLRSFKSQGLVDYRGRRLRILRPDLLEHIRCGSQVPPRNVRKNLGGAD